MKLLHVDSSITGGNSVSRTLSASIVKQLQTGNSGIEVKHLDLAAEPFSHLTLGDIPVPGQSSAVLDHFLEADIVVIGAPMYNFTVPSQLKAWLDRILIAGHTFSYTATGPVGLVGDKRVIIAVTRGGLYGADTPMAAAEHLETYLKSVFGLIGVTPEIVVAEGMLLGPEAHEATLAQANRSISALAA